ncbi:F0F1 ATP synthase subunit delta [Candidatus Pantoea edessiphila]|uniref:ATP synthase subunit delta n=1 Tax=Candidatus Pantoea edessiphila TaxID=2044610 RepID=A0A2P5SZ86_9GAMM|nr:F0F1 ATP synthase subunit delta [Candidatus Pantoea edessiphila]PPI87644.1 F0F1 ATP synthase subunit delta [Candidatus Pantoea edessiphila]
MFKLITIARPYAKAVFNFSVESKSIEYWQQTLTLFSAIVNDKEMKKIFPRNLSSKDMYTIFIKICGNKLNKYSKNLIKLMAENKRLDILPTVLSEFIKLRYHYESTSEINLISASNLNNKQLTDIKNVLEKRLSCKVKLNHKIDNSLISGIVIHLGDLVIDNSISGRLSRLANFLQL